MQQKFVERIHPSQTINKKKGRNYDNIEKMLPLVFDESMEQKAGRDTHQIISPVVASRASMPLRESPGA